MTLWHIFEQAATRHAERTAVEVQRKNGLQGHTYRDLRALAEDRAAWLALQGVGHGDRCAILADNDAHWCAAYLGVLRVGAVAVPLDTNYSAEQVATVVRDAGARVLFANARLTATAREALADAPGVALLDVHEGDGYGGGGPLPPCPATADESAVILYTSGTTSDPKGVVLSHANLIAERDCAFKVVTVSEADAVLGVLPLFHALAQLANLLLPFAVGARVVFLETLNSTELLRALKERGITIFACVPQFFYLIHQRLSSEVEKGGWLKRAVFRGLVNTSFRLRRLGVNVGPLLFGKVHDVMGRQMRFFLTGGSKFDPNVGRDFYALGLTILQAYGLTETSGAVTLTNPDEAHIDTVGRVLPNHELTIMPDGEIAVRGPIVMQGYFNRPDATAAVMQDGWFLTGDLGQMDAEGRVTITGRKKEVIVTPAGKNIYPEEVEAHYRQSPFVKEICVMGRARAGEPTGERLYAVVVPDMEVLRERKIVNAGDIIRFEMEGLGVHLPSMKRVLGYEIWFEALPRTTTGKLKRFEIQRRVEEKQAARAGEAEAPRSEADERWMAEPHAAAALAIVGARASAATAVVPDANLELDLGLDSMERVELLTELEQRFQVKVGEAEAHEIFTVRQLVEAVRPRAGAAAPAAAEESWAVLLNDLPPATDPVLGGLLAPKPLAAPALFALLRLLRVLAPRIEVTGLEHLPAAGPYIISPNHQSYIDPFVLCSVLPYATVRDLFFVGAAEYFESAITRRLARLINLIPVDPDSNLVPAMKAGAFGLRHGKVLVLFPEGERSIDGTVKRFKKGAPILSGHLGVPIVPVAIHGVFELWPRRRALNWKLLLPWSGHRVRLALGAPLQFDLSVSYGDAALRLRAEVARMWDALDARELEGAPVSAD
ncbi:MAG: AMP-binding protein [Acidobacteriota bacterium]